MNFRDMKYISQLIYMLEKRTLIDIRILNTSYTRYEFFSFKSSLMDITFSTRFAIPANIHPVMFLLPSYINP